MSLKLKYWQLPLLFIPFIAGSVILDWPQSDNEAYLRTSAIANFLFVLNTCVLIYYQTYFVLGFNLLSTKKSDIFKWNALVSVFFFTAYLLMVVYSTFIKAAVHQSKHFRGPIQKADFNPTTWVILVFIIHALITFFLINNQFVARQIKKIPNSDEQLILTENFLQPMRKLLSVTIGLLLAAVLINFITDIVKLT